MWTSMFPRGVESLTPRECLALSVLAHGLVFAQWKRDFLSRRLFLLLGVQAALARAQVLERP